MGKAFNTKPGGAISFTGKAVVTLDRVVLDIAHFMVVIPGQPRTRFSLRAGDSPRIIVHGSQLAVEKVKQSGRVYMTAISDVHITVQNAPP